MKNRLLIPFSSAFIILMFLKPIYSNSLPNINPFTMHPKTHYISQGDTLILEKAAPPFQLKTISGKIWNNASLKNNIVVLNFWFIACAPCRSELPLLNQVAQKYKNDTSVVFISISSMDDSDQLQFVKKHWKMQYQLVPARFDICKAFNINKFPSNIVLYQNKVLFKSTGYHSDIDQTLTKVISGIDK